MAIKYTDYATQTRQDFIKKEAKKEEAKKEENDTVFKSI